ncbi:MAG: hypothetical protein K2P84_02140 [Undibacterium sp.]|nr:hypothetical protein [Undibacterium sp.]
MTTSYQQLILSLLTLASFSTLRAQAQDISSTPALACPTPESGNGYVEPGELIRELYRLVSAPAGASKNWTRLRSLHAPNATITFPQHVGDKLHATTYNVEQFTALNDKLFGKRGFFEVELRQEVQIFGHVAHVWSAYASSESVDGKPYTYGINSFQLLNNGQYWCVLSATWDGDVTRHNSIRDWAGLPNASTP